ncbi:MAG: hypothetical protein J6Q85_07840 [Clostridia bacterium]|nr:hypothetical protein [Clostridia bacterium]
MNDLHFTKKRPSEKVGFIFEKVLDFLSLLRDGNLKQHMKNRYLCFNMLQLFIRILDYPVAK